LLSVRSRVLRVCLSVLAFVFLAAPAQAFDLASARQDGRLVAQALARGEAGDWAGAQAMVARSDPLLRDIVLWRKLRDGAGTFAEFSDFVSRRASWPGQEILRHVVLGVPPGRMGPPANDSADRARKVLREVGARQAYAVASQHGMSPAAGYAYSDAEWVAGWIALTRLNDPARGLRHFHRFRDSVETPISVGRGGYWLGRAYEAAGNEAEARRWYADAGQQQTTFYGQLAAARVGMPGDPQLTAAELPDWRTHPAMRADEVRLAAVLYFAGEDSLAMQTFQHLGETLPAGSLAPLTALALDLGQHHFAVRVAKQAAGRGVLIYPAYYPVHDLGRYASKVEPALALSIARQETEMNPHAISRAGARGLMQLMPATAQKVAGWINEPYDAGRLLSDWRYNVRLGETYLARRAAQYGGSYVMAAAAYNAGAGRVDQWVAQFGDPRSSRVDIIDWIEMIPFEETRNYVQRVMEGLYVYRARLSGKAGPMTINQDLARGRR
jgi:soluble lytic murein transglycosylase